MPNKLDLKGIQFGRLVVLQECGRDKYGAVLWQCACDCGATSLVRGASLKSGVTQSCGCGVINAARKSRTHGQTSTPLYIRWRAMISRCKSVGIKTYANYGGRGISVCRAWQRFEQFKADMGPTFSVELELDRKDTNGAYNRENCRWVTRTVQQRNKRTNHRVRWRGKEQTIQDWAEEVGIKANTICHRLRRGWSVRRALLTNS